MSPLVSIIIPVYNSSAFVVEAVRSALGQTYSSIEVIVVDDGSTDNSMLLLEDIKDSRLRVFSQINQGACVARNRGIAEARGEYVKFLDSDDILYPDAIAVQLGQQSRLGKGEVVFGDFDFIDEQGKVFYQNVFDEKTYLSSDQDLWFLSNWEMLITCPLHRREYLVKYKGFDNRLRSGQESFLHLKLSVKGIKFVYQSHRIFGYRSHQDEDRISCQRMRTIPKIEDLVYRNEAMLRLVQDKYGKEANRLSSVLSQRYFDSAWSYFCDGLPIEGKYCLQRCFAIPHLDYPKLKKKQIIARGYVFFGAVIGYLNATKLMNWLIRTFGLSRQENKNNKLQMVLK